MRPRRPCPIHGADAPKRWRRNGRHPNGSPKRTLICALCQPNPRGTSLQGRSTCPRCGGSRIIAVRGGRPGQAEHRGCADCRLAIQRRYRVRMGLAEVPDWALSDDPGVRVFEALEAARAGRPSGRSRNLR